MRLSRALCAAAAALLLTSCSGARPGSPHPGIPAGEQGRADLIKSAQLALVTRCLAGQGLTVPAARERPEATTAEGKRLQAALFGTDPRELSLTLPTGYTVTANTDGCLANAQRALYGDQRRWFEAEVVVNNLRAEAQARLGTDPGYRAALARRTRCTDQSPGIRPEPPVPAATDHCDRDSGLAEARARLEPALLAAVRAERREELSTYQRLRTVAVRRAADLASSSSTTTPTNTP
ncbi:hypothetical protein ACIPUC_02435 [Streptomyces sp. LARHCF249]